MVNSINFVARSPATIHMLQWGSSRAWKVGSKFFAIGGWKKTGKPAFTFKTFELNYHFLSDQADCRPE